jgi:hypothetical protein
MRHAAMTSMTSPTTPELGEFFLVRGGCAHDRVRRTRHVVGGRDEPRASAPPVGLRDPSDLSPGPVEKNGSVLRVDASDGARRNHDAPPKCTPNEERIRIRVGNCTDPPVRGSDREAAYRLRVWDQVHQVSLSSEPFLASRHKRAAVGLRRWGTPAPNKHVVVRKQDPSAGSSVDVGSIIRVTIGPVTQG